MLRKKDQENTIYTKRMRGKQIVHCLYRTVLRIRQRYQGSPHSIRSAQKRGTEPDHWLFRCQGKISNARTPRGGHYEANETEEIFPLSHRLPRATRAAV